MENEVLEKKQSPKLFSMFWSPGEQLNGFVKIQKFGFPYLLLRYLYIVGSTIMAVDNES